MCKFALFALAAVAGVCLVSCQEQLSEACKPTLEYLNKESIKLEEEGPECMKAWREKYNPSGLENLGEYFGGMIKFFQEVGEKEMEECGKETAPYMRSRMGQMIQMLDGVKAVYEENKECSKMINEMGQCILGTW